MLFFWLKTRHNSIYMKLKRNLELERLQENPRFDESFNISKMLQT